MWWWFLELDRSKILYVIRFPDVYFPFFLEISVLLIYIHTQDNAFESSLRVQYSVIVYVVLSYVLINKVHNFTAKEDGTFLPKFFVSLRFSMKHKGKYNNGQYKEL